jgi:predicted kinase
MLKLIVLTGLPGSGKTTIAEGVAHKLGYPVFSVDPIESSMLSVGMKRNYTTGLAAYRVAQILADENLRLGQSVIIDAVNAVPEARQAWEKLARKYKAKLIIIECVYGDETLHRDRVTARVRRLPGFNELTWQEVQEDRKRYKKWQRKHLILDSADPAESNISSAIDYIKTHISKK